MQSQNCSPQKCLAYAGALLFTIGLFTGIWTAAALTGQVHLELPRAALSTHLNALLGGLWLLAISYTCPFLNYSEMQLKLLSRVSILPAWANWLVTFVKSVLGVEGLTYTTDFSNNMIAALLQIFVVIPSLFAGVYWVRGFCLKKNS